MKQEIYVLVLMVTISLISAPVFADGSEEAYVTLVESFGVATEKEGAKYRTVTFIPRTFLLFDIDKEEPDFKVGKQYLAATTQDGVRVFCLKELYQKALSRLCSVTKILYSINLTQFVLKFNATNRMMTNY
ncbi:hypothetical protein HJ090_18425 [Vibrio parahaemolyticus]|nr:hypothetical protein [Vibrio parahaemolyticus]